MSKIFLFLLMLALAMLLLRVLGKSSKRPDAEKPVNPPVERMVSCARCGLHVPQSEAVVDGDRFYCCETHRRGAS
ncbi:MAG: hypothetical protein RIR70_121 [Pseudomonadota bacterium]|jgi:uncharacterized protein